MTTECLSGKSIWFHLRIMIVWCSLKPLECLRWTKVPTSQHWSSQGMQGKNIHGNLSQWGVVPSLGCLLKVTTAVCHMWSLSMVSEWNYYEHGWVMANSFYGWQDSVNYYSVSTTTDYYTLVNVFGFSLLARAYGSWHPWAPSCRFTVWLTFLTKQVKCWLVK